MWEYHSLSRYSERFYRFLLLYIHNVRIKLSNLDTDVAIFLLLDSSPPLHFSLARNKTSEISKIFSHVFPKISHVFFKAPTVLFSPPQWWFNPSLTQVYAFPILCLFSVAQLGAFWKYVLKIRGNKLIDSYLWRNLWRLWSKKCKSAGCARVCARERG